VADHAAKDRPQSIRHTERRPDGLCHRRRAMPGTIRRGGCNESEPAADARRKRVLGCRLPPLGGPTVHHSTCAARPDAHEARPDADAVARAQVETTKIVRRGSDPEREVWPIGCQQRPHFTTDPEIDGMRKGLLHDATARAINVKRMANRDGLNQRHDA
jgi:hypothetical protein